MPEEPRYLGDAVYIKADASTRDLVIYTHGEENTIYLEPAVIGNLIAYLHRHMAKVAEPAP